MKRHCAFLACWLPLAARAHSGSPLAWNADPAVLAPLALSAVAYALGLCRLWQHAGRGAGIRKWQAACFGAGWLALVLALVSPIDGLGEALFSMHMVQHELLMIVAAPLLVLGHPLVVFLWAMPISWRRSAGAAAHWKPWRLTWLTITSPLAAWSIHAAVLWLWHVPLLFQAGLQITFVHTLQHLSFLMAALLFWWSLFDERHSRGIAILYLLTTAMHTGLLGALLTFSTRLWYPVYQPGTLAWGLTALQDQQLGGLIMWVPAGLPYLLFGLWLTARMLQPESQAYRVKTRDPTSWADRQ